MRYPRCILALASYTEIDIEARGSAKCPETIHVWSSRVCRKSAMSLHQLDWDLLDDDVPCYEWRCIEHSHGIHDEPAPVRLRAG